MALDVLAIAGAAAVFVAGLLALAVLFRTQVRRYNRTVYADLLDDWHAQLDLLDPADRQRAALSPPPNVIAAMVGLPAPGLRAGWDAAPVSVLDAAR